MAVLLPDRDVAEIDKIFNDETSVRRLIKRLGHPSGLWACYEAGPTGYDLQRLLNALRSLRRGRAVPRSEGLGRSHQDRSPRRQAPGRVAPGRSAHSRRRPDAGPRGGARPVPHPRRHGPGSNQGPQPPLGLLAASLGHLAGWLDVDPGPRALAGDAPLRGLRLATTYAHYLSTVRLRDSSLEAVETDLEAWCDQEPFGSTVTRLAAYRGVTRIGALCLGAEVFDWRRFPRARPFMSFTGLVPASMSGLSQHRTHITRAGNAHLRGQLCEAAWSYQHRPGVGAGIAQRQKDCTPATVARSWEAQVRLTSRFRQLAAHKNVRSIVAAAVARELAGFLWAEMVSED